MNRMQLAPRADQFIASRMNTSLVWGESDCALFASDFVKFVAGVDPAIDFRGTYTSRIGAAKILRQLKCDDMIDFMKHLADKYGWLERDTPNWGDLCVVDCFGEQSIGVCVGASILAQGTGSLVALPITQAELCWEVA